MRIARHVLLLAVILGLGGCQHMWPNLFHPGTTTAQQQRALLHDPYPDQDAGPAVVGGRPRQYLSPQPEPVRNSPWAWNPFRRN